MDGKADVKCVLFFECTEEVHTLPVQSICIFVENVQRSYLLLCCASLSWVYHCISSHTLYANSPRLSVSLLDKAPISWSSGWVTKALVCYTAVFSNTPPHKWLLRIEPHSFPSVSQLEFSSHFLEGVHATFAVQWLLQSQLCMLLSVPQVWMTEQSKSSRKDKQSHGVVVESPWKLQLVCWKVLEFWC